ncbi:ATP-binding cassette domain-containing protein [uncultured Oscillibacter sp.]|jgi:NitT/TauT family transport system ATP-binding protein|uniref:ABC transporter ATP-binding protein n=1 Tax=uncultured Oscillibacter sp. TaxID=876091 RepID=UPI0025D20884|nr:ATP-binding cassette domain-containing protein [uncultured Oscillibacter sp.]
MMEIRVEGLCKSYGGKPVLTNLTAVFRPGITCVSAPSGTGKTTLLRLLLGLERPDGGSIRGADCRWAAVFQENRLLEDLSAAGNLRFVLGEVPEEAGELLFRLGLELSDPKPVRNWSGGMKRRLALARALLAPAEALALDEPFTGLDGESRARCLEQIRERGGGRPVLLATHDRTGLEDAPIVRLGV